MTLAQLGQRAEVQHAGVNCGIMDQMAASLADTAKRCFSIRARSSVVACRFRPTRRCSFSIRVLRARSRPARSTAARRMRRSARQLGVRALRDIDAGSVSRIDTLAEPWRSRARHVVTENARVLRAVMCSDPTQFGALMNASHASLRDDFDVSVPALDRLVALLQADPMFMERGSPAPASEVRALRCVVPSHCRASVRTVLTPTRAKDSAARFWYPP